MAELYKGQTEEYWQKLLETTFVVGYLKGELRGKGYTEEQLTKLENDAIACYHKNWKA